MKLLAQSILCISLLLLVPVSAHAKSSTSEEYKAVVDTAYNYFEGAANGDQALLSESFDTEFGDVKMLRFDEKTQKETIRTVPLDEFAGFFTKPTAEHWKAEVVSVDIVDSKMALVKMNFITAKTHYIDYLVMYKRDSKWKVVNKTFVAKKLSQAN